MFLFLRSACKVDYSRYIRFFFLCLMEKYFFLEGRIGGIQKYYIGSIIFWFYGYI